MRQETDYPDLQAISDQLDYEFIRDQNLAWVKAIEAEIRNGATPEDIRDWWGQEYKRRAMQERIFHAARHIERELRTG